MTRRNLRLCALLLKILGRLVRRAQADGKARDLSDLGWTAGSPALGCVMRLG
ncbi:hypothetical protein [Nonomuraea sp. NPDC049725]|uniref:hypothetical protein n=1 Tax=Nonomuraea sp. NPDC049725 TaxID=3154508 RepID=UPI00342AB258